MDAKTRYFNSPGEDNTEEVIELSIGRAMERKISHIIVASSSGKTGVMLAERAIPKGIKAVVVTYHYGFSKMGEWEMKASNAERLKKMNVPIVSCSHALSGTERSITKKFGGSSRIEIIAEALRSLFGQGMKVAIEISVMAADVGAIPCKSNTEIVALGGTEEGADTGIVLRPSHSNRFFDLEIREIVAMPRKR